MRLFVALELPEPVRRGLSAWRDALGLAGLRAIADRDLHVTLCFLGEIDDAAWPAIGNAVSGAVAGLGPLSLVLGAPVWLPARRPRVLAVGISDAPGRLRALQAAVASALASDGWYQPERRPYFGHVTVARVRGPVAAPGLPATPRRVAHPPLPAAPPPLTFRAAEVAVIRSRLGTGPARYARLRTIALGGS